MLERSREKLACVLCLLAFSQSGCDIVQGLRDANDAIFPAEKTYFDAPGYRLAVGGYRSLNFALGSSVYLLARSSTPGDTSLYSMLYADPKPCALSNIGPYQAGGGAFSTATMIAYVEEGGSQGTVRFADADCHLYDLTVPNSGIPLLELPVGFVGYEDGDLVLANPLTGTKTTLVAGGRYIVRFDAYNVVYLGGRLGIFTDQLKEAGWFGDGVVAGGVVGASLFFEDKTGIHRVDPAGADEVSDTLIAPDGCSMAFPPSLGGAESWITYDAACSAEHRLSVYGATSRRASRIAPSADPRYVSVLAAYPGGLADPATDPFYYAFLKDVDDQTALGTLIIRTPDQHEIEIGHNAALERVTVVSGPDETHGYALVDVDGDVGRYVRWSSAGVLEEVASSIVRGNGNLVIRGEDQSTDFALLTDAGLTVVGHHLPPGNFRFRDANNRWTLLLDEFDGVGANLSVTPSTLSFTDSVKSPAPPPVLEGIATGVVPDGRLQFVSSLPGVAYLTERDVTHDVGRLEYRNLELRFTAQVSEGVSDYISTSDGLIYAVPFGQGAGIWFTRSR